MAAMPLILLKPKGNVQSTAGAADESAAGLPKRAVLHYDGAFAVPRCGRARGAMEPFRILEHPADIGFEAFGVTCEEAFTNAARALFHLIVDLDSVAPGSVVPVQVEGSDAASLLVNWLSELLYLHDAEGWLFSEFEVQRLDEHSLAARARGEKIDRARHRCKLQVKAITYHQLRLEQTAEGWHAVVYVDI